MRKTICLCLLGASMLAGQPKRVLYITHSAGYRHDCLPTSARVLQDVAERSGRLQVVSTEDVSQLRASVLQEYDAILFFTSGELPITDAQKQDLLAFITSGKGFGGVHSATDTFYNWAEYGELIGARFNGHPWVQQVRIDVEDPAHPAMDRLAPSFSIMDEIYQFREFSRERARVLMTLDTRSVDLNAPGTNERTEDFPLAWCRQYGNGRVFYTALGHFESTWLDERFQKLMLQAMLWLTGQIDADATPRPPVPPQLASDGIANSASFEPRMTVSPGSLISIFGHNLTTGSVLGNDGGGASYKLAGTVVKLNGTPVPLLYASPNQVNAFVPLDLKPQPGYALELSVAGGGLQGTGAARLDASEATPGIFTVTIGGNYLTLWGTGMGPVQQQGDFEVTRLSPAVKIAGTPGRVTYSGLAPGVMGLYQVNVELPANLPSPALVEFQLGGYQHQFQIK
jgi:uncharacterized protein (TIGR03437 family)